MELVDYRCAERRSSVDFVVEVPDEGTSLCERGREDVCIYKEGRSKGLVDTQGSVVNGVGQGWGRTCKFEELLFLGSICRHLVVVDSVRTTRYSRWSTTRTQ